MSLLRKATPGYKPGGAGHTPATELTVSRRAILKTLGACLAAPAATVAFAEEPDKPRQFSADTFQGYFPWMGP